MVHRDDRNQVEGFVAKNNTTFKLKHVKVLVESSVIKVTACRNGNICIEARRAGSEGSMTASGSAGPEFDLWRGSKFSFENFQPRGKEGWRCTLSNR